MITETHDPAITAANAEIANLKTRIRALNATNINAKRRMKELEALLAAK